MIKTGLITLALTLSLASAAHADHYRGFFAGGALSYTIVETDNFADNQADRDEIELFGFEVNGGYKYNTWLGIDIRYGRGLAEKTLGANPDGTPGDIATIEYGIDSYQSVYWRPEITNKEAKLYFLFGHTTLDITATNADTAGAPIGEQKLSESGTSYGMGVGWFLDDHLTLNFEYRLLLDEKEAEFSTASAGVDYRF